MSRADEPGEQATLGAAADRAMERARLSATAEGARYGRTADASHDGIDADPDRDQCARCESDIDATTARVLGDDNGIVPACEQCIASTNGSRFATAAKAVRHWLTDHDSIVDLLEDER